MSSPYSREPKSVKVTPGTVPTIELLDTDCDGPIHETVLSGARILTKAEADHRRYWREMVGTYLRNELGLCPELPSHTKFAINIPQHYELYNATRKSGAKDYYLIGFDRDKTRKKFDSPANFVMHAKWLAYGCPPNACECKPCSGSKQGAVSSRLTLGGAKIAQPRDESTSGRSGRVRSG